MATIKITCIGGTLPIWVHRDKSGIHIGIGNNGMTRPEMLSTLTPELCDILIVALQMARNQRR